MNKHVFFIFFFFNDTATTEIYTLSLHDALPICERVDVVPELAPHERIDAAGGLIEKQHRRGVQRGAGERQALLEAQRQQRGVRVQERRELEHLDRKSTRLNSSHSQISYAVFCLKK